MTTYPTSRAELSALQRAVEDACRDLPHSPFTINLNWPTFVATGQFMRVSLLLQCPAEQPMEERRVSIVTRMREVQSALRVLFPLLQFEESVTYWQEKNEDGVESLGATTIVVWSQ